MNKEEVRRIALSLRKQKDHKAISSKVVNYIISSKILEKYNNIGIYYPIKNEIDITPLVKYYGKKNFYLPKTRDEISFSSYRDGDILALGPFNTKEPITNDVNRDLIECFIVPCVAISNKKRIGYGKGYYDKYLKGYDGTVIGIVYEDAIFDCKMEDYDNVLDIIIVGWYIW